MWMAQTKQTPKLVLCSSLMSRFGNLAKMRTAEDGEEGVGKQDQSDWTFDRKPSSGWAR